MRVGVMRILCGWAAVFGLVAVTAGPALAQTTERAPLRPPDVRYEPTPSEVVAEMLDLANVGPKDVVYDLGCGDGRIVIAAARARGARGVCVDIDPQRIDESKANAAAEGVTGRIEFRLEDLLETELAGATVVTLFLSKDLNRKLRSKLRRELKPGTRVISYVHDMGEWTPTATRGVEGMYGPRNLYLWVIAARP
jgi:SAM-dependent methyltransferase